MTQPPHHAPHLAPLLGRDADLAALRALLARGERLISLIAGAGFGKTRLARALASTVAADHAPAGGVWCVPLGAAGATPDLPYVVAAALGLAATGDGDPCDAVARRLRALGPTLLVLDDVERAIDDARATLATWLAAAPALTVVAASREALGLPGEVRHPVSPLGLGDPDAPGDAERLYTLRAEAVRPGCASTPGWAAAVARLARRLDGNPLALELAAARVAVLPPAALLERLDDRFTLLRDPLGGPGRGLWDSLNASWAALSLDERRALMSLSVFEGPARLDASEAVLAADPGADPAVLPLERVDALARKSLLAPTPATPSGATRLALFDSVRAFARAQLATEPALAAAARAALAAWCERFVAVQEAATRTPDASRARAALLDEVDTVLAAAAPLIERVDHPPSAERAARLLLGVEPALRRVGAAPRVHAMYARATAAPSLPGPVRARLLIARGTLAVKADGPRPSRPLFAEAAALARAHGDDLTEAMARCRSVALLGFADLASIEADCRAAVELLADTDRPWEQAEAWAALAVVRLNRGALDAAREAFERAIPSMRRGAMTSLLGPALNNLGHLHGLAGRWREAAACFREALDAAEADRHLMLAGVVRRNLAEVALRDGADDDARALFEASRAAATEAGDLRTQGVATAFLAGLALLDGDVGEAAALCRDARERLAMTWRDPIAEGLLHALTALVEARTGAAPLAAATMARAATLLEGTGDAALSAALAIHQRHLAALRGETTFDAARAAAAAIDASARRAAASATGPSRHHQVAFAARLLAAASEGGRREVASDRDAPDAGGAPTADALVVAADGSGFVTPAGERVSLARKASARRLVARLAAERTAAGRGRPLSVDDVFELGWPGDRTPEPYRSNRVYVLVAKLRAAGLGAALVHDGEGYRLDPAVDVRVG